MALAFLTDAEIGDAELVIRLDFEGLQSWLKFAATALEARREPLAAAGGETARGGALNAFSKVSLVLVDSAGGETVEAVAA